MIEIFGNPQACVAKLLGDRLVPAHVSNAVSATLAEYDRPFVRVRVHHVPGSALHVDIAEVDPATLVSKTEEPAPL